MTPPLARNLSAKLTHHAISLAIQKVADWQLQRAQPYFNKDWTFAALYAGFMAIPDSVAGNKYRNAMKQMGETFHWQLGPRPFHADDQAIGQTYLELYRQYKDKQMLEPTQRRMDAMIESVDPKTQPRWWWCDALFMAPPVLANLAQITGQQKYLDYMNRQWWITSTQLYDPNEHLFYRDASFLKKREANGKPVFWSRGNGWVMAGLVRLLQAMPPDYPSRPKYIAQLKEMAASLAKVQGRDGLWRPGLLDADAYPLPENSGSAFITYALAYGVNAKILDRKTYEPCVKRAWKGLVSHIYADGRLGSIQPIGAAPGQYTATSSYVFGVGGFLLAGSEVYRMASH
ncbi:MAG TPA: glycoside hydrolase family 88 protein [Acidobacteriaceae bacterium]|nr:glycoside hydrolase family 88 protein [Acidobacteriaceae bacterium]